MSFWEGERVRLRAVEPGDAAFFFELQKDTERNRLLDFLPPPSSLAAFRQEEIADDWTHPLIKIKAWDSDFAPTRRDFGRKEASRLRVA